MFAFLGPKRIEGLEGIDLVLEKENQADIHKGYVPSYDYAMVLHGTDTKVGGVCLRIGENTNIYFGGHIGYGVDQPHRGHGFAAKACRLLAPLARAHGMEEVVITCNPENIPSQRTCERLGAQLVNVVDLPEDNEMYLAGERHKCRYIWCLKE